MTNVPSLHVWKHNKTHYFINQWTLTSTQRGEKAWSLNKQFRWYSGNLLEMRVLKPATAHWPKHSWGESRNLYLASHPGAFSARWRSSTTALVYPLYSADLSSKLLGKHLWHAKCNPSVKPLCGSSPGNNIELTTRRMVNTVYLHSRNVAMRIKELQVQAKTSKEKK